MEQKKWNRNDRRPPLRRAQEPSEAAENMLEGRNAVQEALAAGRPIDKLYIAAGETDRALARLAAMAKEAGAAVVETDRRKLDQLSATGAHQGVVAMVGVFIDTFVVLTMTALVVISTLYAGNGILASGAAEGISKTNMAQIAFSSIMGNTAGSLFVAICLMFFAFSTILGWNFFGRINVEYLFGKKAVPVYSVIAVVLIFLGSCVSNDLAWELSDMFNQLMVIPNFFAIVALGGLVAAAARKGSRQTLEK